jgi:glycosyltransferase involved in cell wall biosynthesis
VKRSLKVVHLFLEFPFGGAEDLALSLVSENQEAVQSQILCIDSLGNLGEKALAESRPIQCQHWVTSRRFQPSVVWKLARWLRENQIDLVHSHVYNAHVYAVPAARLAGIQSVVHHHKTYIAEKWHRQFILKRISRWISRHITLSRQTAEDIHRKIGVPFSEIEVMPNPVLIRKTVSELDKAVLRHRLNLPESAWIMGHVGAFRFEKNHVRLLNAVVQLRNRIPNLRLVLVGEGKTFDKMQARVQKLQIQQYVVFAGAQRPIEPWMQAFDAFVFPSQWEGQPLVLLQAMAARIPILASRIEGNLSALGQEHPGFFSLDIPEDLENTILKLYRQPSWGGDILSHQNVVLATYPDLEGYYKKLSQMYFSVFETLKNGQARTRSDKIKPLINSVFLSLLSSNCF